MLEIVAVEESKMTNVHTQKDSILRSLTKTNLDNV